MDNPGDIRDTIGQAGRDRVKEHWSWHHTAVKTLEQYRLRLADWESDKNNPKNKGK